MNSVEKQFHETLAELQRHAQSWWYAPLIGVLAIIDHFVVFIPVDGLLITSVFVRPHRWITILLIVAVGSSIGALALAWVLKIYGLPFLVKITPGLIGSGIWHWTETFMSEYGALALLAVALLPIMQHPAIAIAALSGMSLYKIFGIVLLGRIIKYGIYCWIASHAPHLINKMWGLRREVEEVQAITEEEGK